jgi:hypothetical protein
MKMNRALILAVLALQLALCQVAVAEVEQTIADSEFATVHMRKKTGATFEFVFDINGQEISSIYGKDHYQTVRLTPGRHVFETWNIYTGGGNEWPGLLAWFDLEVAAGSEIVLDCYGHLGMGSHKIPKKPVLQRWSSYCPEGDLEETNGVRACISPYDYNEKLKTLRDRNAPVGACYLSEDVDSLTPSKQLGATPGIVASIAFSYARAEEVSTIAAYEEFIDSYPDDPLAEDANKHIEFLKEQEVLGARQQKIQTAMQRDARLPLAIRKDKYILSLTDHLNNQNFGEAIFYFELLDQLNVELSPSFEYFWGESLLRTGEPEKALDKLYSYVSNVGSAGQYYTQALQLSTEAETELSQFVD